jgi:ankyrin repeat protein
VDERTDYDGKPDMTALHIASRAGVTSVVNVLLANGATTSIKTAFGNTAAYLAVHWKQWQVLRKLQDYGVVLDARAFGTLEALVAKGYVCLEDIMERQLQLQIPS